MASNGALEAAEIITGGHRDRTTTYDTEYGRKTITGIADLIDQKTAADKLGDFAETIARIELCDDSGDWADRVNLLDELIGRARNLTGIDGPEESVDIMNMF